MFEDKPEISDHLEWMLQSRQVGDETLVETLVEEHFAHLVCFGQALFDSESDRQAKKLAEKIILNAVENASQYRGDVSVKVWLLQDTVRSFKMVSARSSQRKFKEAGHEKTKDQDPDNEIWEALSRMDEGMRQAYLLKYHQGLDEGEIALVFGIEREWLTAGFEQTEEEIRGESLGKKFDGDVIEHSLKNLWPVKPLSRGEAGRITRRIMSALTAKERAKHRAVIFGEFILVLLVVATIIGISSAIRILSPVSTPVPVLQTRLVNQVVYITSTPGPTTIPTPFPEQAVLYNANQGETLHEIAEQIFLNVEILEALNNIPADQPLIEGQKVMIGVRDNRIVVPELLRSTPAATLDSPTQVPLDLESSEQDIQQRLLEGRRNWKTLWADAFVIQYGPAGYIGNPVVKRQQIWINQPYFSYFLEGGLDGAVDHISVAMAGLINYINLQTGEELSNSESELVMFSENLHKQLLPSEIRKAFQGEIRLLGMDQIADREVLVFDLYSPNLVQESATIPRIHKGRYWMDTTYGVILRHQKFLDNDLNQLFEDTVITAIEYDIDIPERLYDSSQHMQTYFAQDHRGDPISRDDPLPTNLWSHQPRSDELPRPSPPHGFTPARSHLSFQWTSLSEFDPELGAYVDIFADGYYLGNVEFVDPQPILCTRSPDGTLLAYTGWSDETRFGYVPLRWLSLNDLGKVNTLSENIVPYDFAFAPDNRQLAVYGCLREVGGDCGIHIIDTDTGETRWLTQVEQGNGLTWSPDSKFLAIQGRLLRQGRWRVLAFDTQTGTISYDGPFDWEGIWVEIDSPFYDWGVDLPPVRGGLEICAEPPRED